MVTKTGKLVQPVQWSSEMNKKELKLVCCNYRSYNPADGRWINRDSIAEEGGWNLYGFARNNGGIVWDELVLVPNGQDPLFIFPYVDENTGYGQMTYASKDEIKRFYDAVNAFSQKIVPHTLAIQQLTVEVNSLLNSEDCPCKNVCILSGPINQ